MLDEIIYKGNAVGFLLLGIGIITGAVWANYAWGSYWSWDPKETWSLITWLIYAAFLHARLNERMEGKQNGNPFPLSVFVGSSLPFSASIMSSQDFTAMPNFS